MIELRHEGAAGDDHVAHGRIPLCCLSIVVLKGLGGVSLDLFQSEAVPGLQIELVFPLDSLVLAAVIHPGSGGDKSLEVLETGTRDSADAFRQGLCRGLVLAEPNQVQVLAAFSQNLADGLRAVRITPAVKAGKDNAVLFHRRQLQNGPGAAGGKLTKFAHWVLLSDGPDSGR